MVERIFRLLLCVVFLASGYDCHQWSSHLTAGTVKYTCVGSTAMLPWTVAMENGEIIHDVMWQYQTPSGPQTVAYYAGGIFMPGPGYAGRVSYVPNAGIMLTGLSKNDTGNYTVEVTGRNGSQMWSLNQDGFLQVLDNTVVVGNGLQVVQQPKAVYDNATGEWMVDVTCGDFPFPTQPPFDVQWTTPSGSLKPSSHYEHGKFHLLLPASEASGNYSCHVTQQTSCSSSPSGSGSDASLVMDDIKARLALLEAEVKDSKAGSNQLASLTQENALLQQNQKLIEEQNKHLMEEKTQLTQQNAQTVQDNAKLFQRLQMLEDNFNQLNSMFKGVNSSSISNTSSQTCCGLNQTVNDLQQTMVDEVARLTHLFDQHSSQAHQNDQLCSTISHQTQRLAVQVNQTNAEIDDLKREVLFLQQYQVNQLNTTGSVHFHARSNAQDNNHARSDAILCLSDVTENSSSAYRKGTGIFTAPVSGIYFFLGSTEFYADCQHDCAAQGGLGLVADNQVLDYVDLWMSKVAAATGNQTGTVHAAVHLNRDARVWLQNGQLSANYVAGVTSFTGFLISQD